MRFAAGRRSMGGWRDRLRSPDMNMVEARADTKRKKRARAEALVAKDGLSRGSRVPIAPAQQAAQYAFNANPRAVISCPRGFW